MITHWKTTILAIALLFSVASVLVLSSCGGDDEPEPEPIIPPGLSYTAATVAVGSTGTLTPAVQGDAATYSITDNGDADFVTIDAGTGVLSVAAESTTGVYTVAVKATNSAGSADATVDITIGVNDDFDPTGKKLLWRYFINQDDDITLTGLDGELLGLQIPSLQLPVGWPTEATPQEDLWQYFLLTEIERLIFQVPGDEACGALIPEEGGDTLLIVVNSDLSLSTECTLNDSPGSSADIGISWISYAEGAFSYTISLVFIPEASLSVPYKIEGANFTDFTDPVEQTIYPALLGRVNAFTTPADFTNQAAMENPLNWKNPMVDVVLKVLE